jgi:hypothetical protein
MQLNKIISPAAKAVATDYTEAQKSGYILLVFLWRCCSFLQRSSSLHTLVSPHYPWLTAVAALQSSPFPFPLAITGWAFCIIFTT